MTDISALLPPAGTIAGYTVACLILFLTPGPDMSLFLAKTISGGRRAGLLSMLGAMGGTLVHTLLAAFGLSAILAASATAFTVLKVVGAAYLLWLAWDAVRNGSALRLRETPSDGPSRLSSGRIFLAGFGVNLTNPKVVLFFVTFLPQFVDPRHPHASAQLLFLGLTFVVLSAPLGALMVLGAERAIGLMTRRPRLMRALDLAFASVFGFFALRIATLSRS